MTEPNWRLQKWGLYIAGGLAWVVAICVVLLTITSFRTADQTTRIEQGNRVASCRATHRVQVDDAQANLALRQADLLNIATQAQQANLTDDGIAVAGALASMPQAQSSLMAAMTQLQQTIVDYSDSIELSRSHPDQFIADCSP